MTNSPANKQSLSSKNSLKQTDPEKYARLKAEAQAPYKGLRVFFYLAFGASGFIGAIVFLAQLAAGQNVTSALPNFALQIGLVALTIWLIRWENK
jgi:Low psii accumulation1 / Rep27